MASLLYGSGLRLLKCLRLRVHDIEFDRRQIMVRDGKEGKDRVTVLPDPVAEPLRRQIEKVRIIHEEDTLKGLGEVYLPFALERKYPNAARAFGWQYLLPADMLSRDPRSGKIRRPHATLYTTHSPPIYWSKARMFVRCRNCSGTRTSERHRFIRMSWVGAPSAS